MKLFFFKMLKKLLFLVVLCVATHIQAMEKEEQKALSPAIGEVQDTKSTDISSYNYSPRALFIFLDDSEKRLGPVSNGFMEALNKKAGPVIVSKHLVDLVFSAESHLKRRRNMPKIQELLDETDPEKLFDIAWEPLPFDDQCLSDKKELYILTKASTFNEKEWLIKWIDNRLLLLIPYDHLRNLGIEENDARKSPSSYVDFDGASNAELILGLKINHMHTVNSFGQIAIMPKLKSNFNFIDYLVGGKGKDKSAIFCVRSDYINKKNIDLPLWSIYMDGHGLYEKEIVGLKLQ